MYLAEDHPLGIIPYRLPIQQALNRERTTPAHQAFISQKRRETVQAATLTPRAKKGHARRTPRDTH